jgi:type IV secretion system protein VirB1
MILLYINKCQQFSTFLCFLSLAAVFPAASPLRAQTNTGFSLAQFAQLAARCAPASPVDTLQAVALTESALHPYALSLNYPGTVATINGLPNREVFLSRQPTTLGEAIRWTRWFHSRGYTVSIGLMQISSENAARYGVTVRSLFNPCVNLAVGARLLADIYGTSDHARGASAESLVQTFSAYNSGSFSIGVANGYASTVMRNGAHGQGEAK